MNNLYNSYHHIVIVRDVKQQKLLLYIGGNLSVEKDINPVGNIEKHPTFIGKHNIGIDDSLGRRTMYGAHFLKGKIDYLRIYNLAISPKRINKMYRKESRTPYKHEYKSKKECETYKHHTDKINASIKMYPNPSRGYFKVSSDIKMDCKEIRIYNHHGKIVFRSSFRRDINANHLKPGHYTVVLITPHRNYNRRLVITR